MKVFLFDANITTIEGTFCITVLKESLHTNSENECHSPKYMKLVVDCKVVNDTPSREIKKTLVIYLAHSKLYIKVDDLILGKDSELVDFWEGYLSEFYISSIFLDC